MKGGAGFWEMRGLEQRLEAGDTGAGKFAKGCERLGHDPMQRRVPKNLLEAAHRMIERLSGLPGF